jgi:hypothetical protein
VVHDAIAALADHLVVGEHARSVFQLLERVPVAPAQVRHLWHPRLAAAATALAAGPPRRAPTAPLVVRRRLLLRERDAVLLARIDLDGVRRRRLERLSERRLGRGGWGRSATGGNFLDVLGGLGGVLGLGIGRGDGEVEDGGGLDGTPATASAGRKEAHQREEDEKEHEGGADADADELPQVKPEHQRALGQLRLRHGRDGAELPSSRRNGGSPWIPTRIGR